MRSETILVPKKEYESLKREVKLLRNSATYKRLFEFEKNISFGKKFYRKDLGF